jgi:hypothetical protein
MIAMAKSPALALSAKSCSPSLLMEGKFDPDGGSSENTAACAVPVASVCVTSASNAGVARRSWHTPGNFVTDGL